MWDWKMQDPDNEGPLTHGLSGTMHHKCSRDVKLTRTAYMSTVNT